MSQQIKIQVGIEIVPDPSKPEERDVRLTPLDETLEVDSNIAQILLLVRNGFDAVDKQPGDNEIDIPLNLDAEKIRPIAQLKPFVEMLGDIEKANIFIRFTPV